MSKYDLAYLRNIFTLKLISDASLEQLCLVQWEYPQPIDIKINIHIEIKFYLSLVWNVLLF